MNIRFLIKEKLPKGILPFLRFIFKIKFYLPYWFYYCFSKGIAPSPDRLVYETTFFCNQSCAMCSFASDLKNKDSKLREKWKEKGELSLEEIEKLATQAKSLGVNIFTISGGEPFLRKDIFDIISAVKGKGLTVALRSNGTLINEQTASLIVEKRVDSIVFSLDGPEKIHNEIRNEKNAFKKLLDAVQLIQRAKEKKGTYLPNMSFNCTVSGANAGYLNEVAKTAGKIGTDIVFTFVSYITEEMLEKTDRIFSGGKSEFSDMDIDEQLKNVNTDELIKELAEAKKTGRKYGIEVKSSPPLKKREVNSYFNDSDFTFTDKCLYPWYHVRVNPYGEVNPCSLNMPMGNIRTETLAKIWNNEKYRQFRVNLKKNRLFPKCSRCCALNERIWTYLPPF